MDGLIGLLLRASGRTVFVLFRRIGLVLTQQTRLLFYFWEKAHEAGILDSGSNLALILCRSAGHRAWGDFSVSSDEALKKFHILVINVFDVILLEVANFATGMHFLKSHGLIPFVLVF